MPYLSQLHNQEEILRCLITKARFQRQVLYGGMVTIACTPVENIHVAVGLQAGSAAGEPAFLRATIDFLNPHSITRR